MRACGARDRKARSVTHSESRIVVVLSRKADPVAHQGTFGSARLTHDARPTAGWYPVQDTPQPPADGSHRFLAAPRHSQLKFSITLGSCVFTRSSAKKARARSVY